MNTGGGFFGNNNNASTGGTGGFGGGGFGSATNNNNPTFGSGTASGGGLFGAPKPTSGFGTTGATMFGASGFGAANNTNNNQTGFGSSPTTGPAAECQGTLQPQFAVTTEKEANSSAMNHFQSIVHMPNYQRWSFEELRLADYRSGRQFANANGQAGTFGASTGFGGFSNNNNNQNQGGMFGANNNTAQAGGGLFGNNNNANTGFGTNNQASSPFGGFGANKPAAAGGLFGAPTNNATQNAGSMFGGAGSGFGAPSTGTGFGANNNTAGGFSSSSAAKPTLFGTQPTGPSLFANVNTNNNNTGGGLFGSSNQNQTGFGNPQSNATPNAFTTGSTLGGGTFGSNPANKNTLFSSTPATNTGSMFGGAPQSNQTGGLFGNTNPTNNNSNSNSLFGSKPAASSLFGNQPQPQNQGTGLFGNTQQNQPAQGGLFGGTNNQGGGLFGSSNSQNNTGTGIFGNQPQQQPQQQPQNSLFGNLSNTNQPVNLQPPQGLNASIFDPRPYGSVSIYDGLPPPSAQNIGPIATPISAGQRQMKPAVLPQWKLNPTMSPRFVTPQKQGYGFSYSRYGTPSSISSVASTPGHFGNSLLGASFGRTIGKSVSVSNLRRNYDSDTESVLAPGAFTASSRLGGQHSLKRLNIDRSLRNDLFAPVTQGSTNNDKRETRGPSSLKKRVSFEANSLDENQNEDSSRNESSFYSPTPSAKEQGYLRSSVGRNMFNGQPTKERRSQETSPIKVNELAIVPEDEAPETSHSSTSTIGLNSSRPGDPEPGKYSTRPSIEELKKLTPEQLKKVSGFVVSRENVGSCAFQRSVDLSGIKWNTFFDLMVKFTVRSICVYPDQAKKPPLGMGMNVPSIITLENCWPRSHSVRSGPRLDKHIRHLKSVKNCEFISYNVDKGEWSFRVPHFTTYGLDYDDDDDMDTDTPTHNSSMLSDTFSQATLAFIHAAKERPVNSAINQTIQNDQDSNIEDSGPEDTFSFKGTKQIPGGFDAISVSEDEEMEMQKIQRPGQSFLDDRSAVPESEDEGEPSEIEEGEDGANQLSIAQDTDLDIDMAGAFPEEKTHPPKPILKQTTFKDDGHRKLQMLLGNDWTEQLQRTISPQKRDRQELKASQAFFFRDLDLDDIHSPTKKSKIDEPRLETSIDLINSLFGKEDSKRSNGGIKTLNYRKGFKVCAPPSSHVLTAHIRLNLASGAKFSM